jgi:hypothetical protein
MVVSAFVVPRVARSEQPPARALTVFVDSDDDDDDGVPDALSSSLGGAAARDVVWLSESDVGVLRRADADAVRLVVRDRPRSLDQVVGRRGLGRVGVQGLRAGRATLEFERARVEVTVVEARALAEDGTVIDLARSHASLSRVLPFGLRSRGSPHDDDATSWLVLGPAGSLPMQATLESTRPDGTPLDRAVEAPLSPLPCPTGTPDSFACRKSPPIRATADPIDRRHPEALEHSLLAEVGGRIALVVDGVEAASLRIGGPRSTRLGPIGRFRGKVRLHVVRIAPSGAVPIGGDEESALEMARAELRVASNLWGQCGIHFGYGSDVFVRVVDPPPSQLLAIGCDLGLPASGGELRFRVGSRPGRFMLAPGESPVAVATRVTEWLEAQGMNASAHLNPRIVPGARRTVDVMVRGVAGFSRIDTDGAHPLSTDPTLRVCLGEVQLSDGLTHFDDFDAMAGTLEERSLLRAYDDGDPATIEVFIVPSFAQSGRIGESFIFGDGASVENSVILDRAGVLAGARSYALAHELGHILLDMPGHPDDYGVDQSVLLMDADAADPTIFGPRRLTVAECERALIQSGPGSPVPLLEPWPLFDPAPKAARAAGGVRR